MQPSTEKAGRIERLKWCVTMNNEGTDPNAVLSVISGLSSSIGNASIGMSMLHQQTESRTSIFLQISFFIFGGCIR